jgi:hypothetical protein
MRTPGVRVSCVLAFAAARWNLARIGLPSSTQPRFRTGNRSAASFVSNDEEGGETMTFPHKKLVIGGTLVALTVLVVVLVLVYAGGGGSGGGGY